MVSYASTIFLGLSCGLPPRMLCLWAAKEVYWPSFGKRPSGPKTSSVAPTKWTIAEMRAHSDYLQSIVRANPGMGRGQLIATILRDCNAACSDYACKQWLQENKEREAPMQSSAASSSAAPATRARWSGEEMLAHDSYLRGLLAARPGLSRQQLVTAIQEDHGCVCGENLARDWLTNVRKDNLSLEQMREYYLPWIREVLTEHPDWAETMVGKRFQDDHGLKCTRRTMETILLELKEAPAEAAMDGAAHLANSE